MGKHSAQGKNPAGVNGNAKDQLAGTNGIGKHAASPTTPRSTARGHKPQHSSGK